MQIRRSRPSCTADCHVSRPRAFCSLFALNTCVLQMLGRQHAWFNHDTQAGMPSRRGDERGKWAHYSCSNALERRSGRLILYTSLYAQRRQLMPIRRAINTSANVAHFYLTHASTDMSQGCNSSTQGSATHLACAWESASC